MKELKRVLPGMVFLMLIMVSASAQKETESIGGKEHEMNPGSTVRDAVRKIGLPPETVLAVVDGKLITDDTVLREGMQVKLVAVISGGGA